MPRTPGMRAVALAATAAVSLLASPAIGASYNTDKLKAASAVEAKLKTKYPRWKWLANCKAKSSRTFSCTAAGFRSNHAANGRATVRKSGKSFRVTIVSLKFS